MNPNDPNIRLLGIVADRLGDALCKELVFVGGDAASQARLPELTDKLHQLARL